MQEEAGGKEKEPSLEELRAVDVDYKALMLAMVERAYFDCVELPNSIRGGYKRFSDYRTGEELKSAMKFMFKDSLEEDLRALDIDPDFIRIKDMRRKILALRASAQKQAVPTQ